MNKMLKKIIVFPLVVFFVSLKITGAEIMTLYDCMEYAISNSTKIKIQRTDISDKRLEIRDAILTAFTPSINGNISGSYSFGRSIDPETNTYFNSTSFSNGYSVSAGIPIFDGFKAVNNIKISKTGLLISKSQEKQIEADLCLAVIEAFYNVVYYKNLAKVIKKQVEASELSLTTAKRQEELGIKGYADVIEMEAELSDRKYDLITTENMYKDQILSLEALIFWPEEEELIIDEELPMVFNEEFEETLVLQNAMLHNPAVEIAKWNVENARHSLNSARWQLLPSINFYTGWSTSYYTYTGGMGTPFRQQFRNNSGEYVQFSMSIPIYNNLTGHSNVSRKKNALIKAQSELDQTQRDIESEIKRAIQDRDGASVAYTQALKKAKVQEEAFTFNQKKLAQGLISPLEFQTANNNYLKSKADEMNSLFQYIIKQAVVKYYSGIDYINQF